MTEKLSLLTKEIVRVDTDEYFNHIKEVVFQFTEPESTDGLTKDWIDTIAEALFYLRSDENKKIHICHLPCGRGFRLGIVLGYLQQQDTWLIFDGCDVQLCYPDGGAMLPIRNGIITMAEYFHESLHRGNLAPCFADFTALFDKLNTEQTAEMLPNSQAILDLSTWEGFSFAISAEGSQPNNLACNFLDEILHAYRIKNELKCQNSKALTPLKLVTAEGIGTALYQSILKNPDGPDIDLIIRHPYPEIAVTTTAVRYRYYAVENVIKIDVANCRRGIAAVVENGHYVTKIKAFWNDSNRLIAKAILLGGHVSLLDNDETWWAEDQDLSEYFETCEPEQTVAIL